MCFATMATSHTTTYRVYRPGETVPESGIYLVHHSGNHRQEHELVLLKERAFPACEICDCAVRFELIQTAPYVLDDEDFR